SEEEAEPEEKGDVRAEKTRSSQPQTQSGADAKGILRPAAKQAASAVATAVRFSRWDAEKTEEEINAAFESHQQPAMLTAMEMAHGASAAPLQHIPPSLTAAVGTGSATDRSHQPPQLSSPADVGEFAGSAALHEYGPALPDDLLDGDASASNRR